MDASSAARLRKGDKITVRWGSDGTQAAEVLGPPISSGKIPVRKYRANSRKWTGRVLVSPREIIGRRA